MTRVATLVTSAVSADNADSILGHRANNKQKVGAVWKHTGGYRRIPYLAAVDTTHTRPVPAAHTPIAELYRAGWAIPIASKLPGGKRLGASPASRSVARSESI